MHSRVMLGGLQSQRRRLDESVCLGSSIQHTVQVILKLYRLENVDHSHQGYGIKKAFQGTRWVFLKARRVRDAEVSGV